MHQRQHIFVPPKVLWRNNASGVHAAQQAGSGPVSFAKLPELARMCRLLAFCEVVDSCKVNVRKQRKAMKVFATELPGNCVYLHGPCRSHICHIILSDGAAEKDVIGDIYALEYVSQVPHIQTKIIMGARRWLRRRLKLYWGVSPPQQGLSQFDRIIQHTLARNDNFVAGRLEFSDLVLS